MGCVANILVGYSICFDGCGCCDWVNNVGVAAKWLRVERATGGMIGMRDHRGASCGIAESSACSNDFWSAHNTCYTESL